MRGMADEQPSIHHARTKAIATMMYSNLETKPFNYLKKNVVFKFRSTIYLYEVGRALAIG